MNSGILSSYVEGWLSTAWPKLQYGLASESVSTFFIGPMLISISNASTHFRMLS